MREATDGEAELSALLLGHFCRCSLSLQFWLKKSENEFQSIWIVDTQLEWKELISQATAFNERERANKNRSLRLRYIRTVKSYNVVVYCTRPRLSSNR